MILYVMFIVLYIIGTLFIGISLVKYVRILTFWRQKGLKGPIPWPVIGNTGQIILGDRFKQDLEWMQKYGKIYGIFTGTLPRLVVADAEVLNQICTKDFDIFTNHYAFRLNSYQKSFLIFAKDDHWKTIRSLVTPTFTSSKIKRMFKLLDLCTDDLISALKDKISTSKDNSATIDSKRSFLLFTMDSITTCCYGLRLKRAESDETTKKIATRDQLVEMSLKLSKKSWYKIISLFFVPSFLYRWFRLEVYPVEQFHPLANLIKLVIDDRRKSKLKFADYLQLLVDANLNAKVEHNEMDFKENHHADLSETSINRDQNDMVKYLTSELGLTQEMAFNDDDMVANAMFLLVVGSGTTSSFLELTTSTLAFNQDVQERLYQELVKISKFDSKTRSYSFDYDSLTSCQYLDAVISESMRFSPPSVQMDRVANRDYTIEKYDMKIKEGQVVNLNYMSIMNDPDYWDEPRKFDPERFMPENRSKIVPGSYCPFGLGPRYCVGMRFSLTESKLALAKLIMNFKLKPASDAKYPPEARFSLTTVSTKHMRLKLIPRR